MRVKNGGAMPRNCLKCAKQGRDCCREAHAKFLTLKDAERIAGYLGIPVNAFALYGGLKDEDREEYIYINRDQRYYYDLTRRDDRLLQLKYKSNGSCMFQNHHGRCDIYPVRPLICRTYPFWLSEEGDIIFDGCSSDCPIVCAATGNDEPEDIAKLVDPNGVARARVIERIGCSREDMKTFLNQMMIEIEDYRINIDTFVATNGIAKPELEPGPAWLENTIPPLHAIPSVSVKRRLR